MGISKTNTNLKRSVNKFFAVENTYHDTKQKPSHKEIHSPCELLIFMKENSNYTLHLRTNFWSMMGEEHLNALSLICNHRDIFLVYDKIISIYAYKYPRRMLLINALREN